MKSYRATTIIKTSPETIWEILTDAAGYPDWDPAMERIEGHIALGETVKFFTKLSPKAFPVRVTSFEPAQKMVFTGGLPLGLFKSERTHTLTQNQDGSTTIDTHEVFSGLLLPLFGRTIPDLTENFNGFVAALKEQAEGAGRS
nr:putative integron gene cassette protein [uncultured bacterium]